MKSSLPGGLEQVQIEDDNSAFMHGSAANAVHRSDWGRILFMALIVLFTPLVITIITGGLRSVDQPMTGILP